MGLAASALPQLAALVVRSAGSVYGTASFFNGRMGYTLFLYFVLHVVILFNAGVPPGVASDDELLAYFLTWPIVATAAALVAYVFFHMLRLAELMPLKRYFVKTCCGYPMGPRPALVPLIVNTVLWAVACVVAPILYEVYAASDAVLAIVLANVLTAGAYILLFVFHYFFMSVKSRALFFVGETAVPAKIVRQTVLRSILIPGVFHTVITLVGTLFAFFAVDAYNYTWVATVITIGIILVVGIIVRFALGARWVLPPRTGKTGGIGKLPAPAADAEEETSETEDSEEIVTAELVDESTEMSARNLFGASGSQYATSQRRH